MARPGVGTLTSTGTSPAQSRGAVEEIERSKVVPVTIVASTPFKGTRRFGPFEGTRIRQGRLLYVKEQGIWHLFAFCIPVHGSAKYDLKGRTGRVVISPCEIPLVSERTFAIWRFLDENGKAIGFDAENLDFVS